MDRIEKFNKKYAHTPLVAARRKDFNTMATPVEAKKAKPRPFAHVKIKAKKIRRRAKRKWSGLTAVQKRMIYTSGLVTGVLLGVMASASANLHDFNFGAQKIQEPDPIEILAQKRRDEVIAPIQDAFRELGYEITDPRGEIRETTALAALNATRDYNVAPSTAFDAGYLLSLNAAVDKKRIEDEIRAKEQAIIDKYDGKGGIFQTIELWAFRKGLTAQEENYLVNLAHYESSFCSEPDTPRSTAAGCFHYTEQTWFKNFRDHAEKYGGKNLADKIEPYVYKGATYYRVKDDATEKEILDLRYDLNWATVIQIEKMRVDDEVSKKRGLVSENITRFANHYLGIGLKGGYKLLRINEIEPTAEADIHFSAAAKANKDVFYETSEVDGVEVKTPRTVAEVVNLLKGRVTQYNGSTYAAFQKWVMTRDRLRKPAIIEAKVTAGLLPKSANL